ncbi:MAG: sigma 54-interacting transcriptional regulator, partial [Caldimicrobium sp.]|nr:sigma 54-interacting transcriptional regulator [Caldimicrobium sp.]
AATNKDLSEETKRGNFRKDLYHRLNVVNIKIPPLRERREDIPLLVEFFVKKYAREADLKIRGITKDALEVLLNYSWPGNVRELENVLRRAVILSKGSYITKDELFLDKEKRELSFVKTIEDLVNSVLLSGQNSPYHALLSQIEQIMIQRALEITGGNQLKASFLLGINRLTLRKKIKEYNIKK